MINPPVIDERSGERASALGEAARVVADLVKAEHERSASSSRARRRGTHAPRARAARPRARRSRDSLRAGYTAQQRRELEQRLTDGDLLAVITTDALELGIDIGRLDACVVVTFPGTVASLRQMWGRAGRRGSGPGGLPRRRGRARPVLLPAPGRVPRATGRGSDPRPRKPADLPRAPALRGRGGAAREGDEEFLGPAGRRARNSSSAAESCARATGRAAANTCRARRSLPGRRCLAALRGARAGGDRQRDSGELLGNVEAARSHTTVHEGAVYMHLGRSYLVRALDERRPRARRAVRRRLVHAAAQRDRHRDPRARRAPRGCGCAALVRRRGGDRDGPRLPAQAAKRPRPDGHTALELAR